MKDIRNSRRPLHSWCNCRQILSGHSTSPKIFEATRKHLLLEVRTRAQLIVRSLHGSLGENELEESIQQLSAMNEALIELRRTKPSDFPAAQQLEFSNGRWNAIEAWRAAFTNPNPQRT